MERINTKSESNNPGNWNSSISSTKATPGGSNSIAPKVYDILIDKFYVNKNLVIYPEQVTLTADQVGHSHTLRASNLTGDTHVPTGNTLADDSPDTTYRDTAPTAEMHPDSISDHTGSGGSHANLPPYLGVYCSIALTGVYPSRN